MIENIFKNKEPKFYHLAQGIHNNNFYFGKVVYIKNQPTDCIVLSNKQYLVDYNRINTIKEEKGADNKIKKFKGPLGDNQIKLAGINYRNNLLEQNTFWSNESINQFITNESEPINKRNLFYEIKNTYDYYLDVKDPRIFDIMTCFVIGTYCFTMFDAYGYPFVNSEKNSGKTKLTNITGYLAFNAINATNPTESALFRLCEANKPTFIIDDYEKIDDDKQRYINQILKTGYKKGGQTMRTESRNNMFSVKLFDLYSPKIINNTGDIDDITLSRCFIIRLLRTKTEKGKRSPDENDDIWQEIKNKIYTFIIQNWKAIYEIYKNYQSSKFNNRDLEVSKGILSVAKYIGDDIHQNIEDYLSDSFDDRDYIDYSTNKHYLLFKTIHDHIDTSDYYTVKQIESWLNKDPENFPTYKNYSYWVGKTLSKIPIFKKNKKKKARGREYFISKDILEDYMGRQGYPFEDTLENIIEFNKDKLKELNEPIRDNCYNCKILQYVKYTSILTTGRNYCDTCVTKDTNKETKKENEVVQNGYK